METPSTVTDAGTRSLLDAQLEGLGLDRNTPPGPDQWQPLLGLLEKACSILTTHESEGVEAVLRREVVRRRSSQTNLFEQSPIAILQLDMSALETPRVISGATNGSLVGLLTRIRITAANEAATTLLGIPPRPADEPLDVGHIGVSDVAWTALTEMVMTRETSSEIEFVGTLPDGGTFEALLLATVPEPFEIPDYSRVVVAMTDITAHKAEERRMHDLITAKNRLVASVTTELRSPLAKVVDFARLLEEPVDDAERRRGLAVAIAGGATRVAGIVEDLLVVSRSELGDLPVAEVPVDLSAQVAQVLEVGGSSMAEVSTPGRNVERRVCLGDPARIRQIIRNLITDAVDHGGRDTTITIHRRSSTVFLTVSWVGQPLDTDLRRRVFGPSTGELGTTVDPDARFMGLSVARQLAIRMGGELSYDHEAGVGKFEVTLCSAPPK